MKEKEFYLTQIGTIEIVSDNKVLKEVNIQEEDPLKVKNLIEADRFVSLDDLVLSIKEDYTIDWSDSSRWQQTVWNELNNIPLAETRTYQEIADILGSPKAARAVGAACASNRLALIVPCHRVVPSSKGIGRYRWGESKKKEILDFEKSLLSMVDAKSIPELF